MSISQATRNRTNTSTTVVHDSIRREGYLEKVLIEVVSVIAPVWPLEDYVAVNPYAGLSRRSFLDARTFLRNYSDCEMLMPIEYYANEFERGAFVESDIESAMAELAAVDVSQELTAAQIVQNLNAVGSFVSALAQPAATHNEDRRIRTIAEWASTKTDIDWSEAIVEEISKHCAAHYDLDQATWSSPVKHLSLFDAWRATAENDFNIEVLGLRGFRRFVSALPNTPETVIAYALKSLSVPRSLWSAFLLSQAFSIPGWSAWTKYKSEWASDASGSNDLVGLLAIRLAYDAALAKSKSLRINWQSLAELESASNVAHSAHAGDSILRLILLRACEIAFRNRLLTQLPDRAPSMTTAEAGTEVRKLAQMVFCIDVRSERIRRQLESQSNDIETFGFAGFFGMAFEFATMGQSSGNLQLPVLLKPQFKACEGIHESELAEAPLVDQLQRSQTWHKCWKSFQSSAASCFTFVESAGLLSGLGLLRRATGIALKPTKAKFDGLTPDQRSQVGPTLRGLCQQGITTSRQADIAESMLRNLGLTNNFAQFVVLCGHACQTENNPLAAGLDCGACGGHSGEPNARFAALLLNQPYIRGALKERGINIPADTFFVGGLHNTTTDQISFFDVDAIEADQQSALQELRVSCDAASRQVQAERAPTLSSSSLPALLKRAGDWSEVRPEWGLAGNAAFIAARRTITKDLNLDARAFLHSYDYTQDPDGKVLETIMTAPMIVAHWINMQYYASTVDNRYFGSGTKTVHNVVGGFGILSGNGGDLMTGLPWQSLHNGTQYQHAPLRLQVVIEAPREMIDRVVAKHELVASLLTGGWLHLVAIDGAELYRLNSSASWERLAIQRPVTTEGTVTTCTVTTCTVTTCTVTTCIDTAKTVPNC